MSDQDRIRGGNERIGTVLEFPPIGMNAYIHFLNINSVFFGQTNSIVRKYSAHNLGSSDSFGFVRLPPHDLINETDLTGSD